MVSDPPIHVGDIVRVDMEDISGPGSNFVAKICKMTPTEGVDLDTAGGGWKSVALERCYHATEQEKAEYFKLVLKYGR